MRETLIWLLPAFNENGWNIQSDFRLVEIFITQEQTQQFFPYFDWVAEDFG